MLVAAQFIAALAATLFAGAAIYINVAEHPARMSCSTELAATVWGPSYDRASVMQASLAIVGFLAGMIAWALGSGGPWLVASLALFLVVPFTLVVIKPTNKRLQEPGRDRSSAATRALLVRWGRLHAVRSALSSIAAVLFLWLLASR